jgi:hypothetical protein
VVLWELSLLLLAILLVGGLAWMFQKRSSRRSPFRKKVNPARQKNTKTLHPIEKSRDMEAAEEVIPPPRETPQKESAPHPLPAIPWLYGDTKIVAVARDPYWIFTYWEINGAVREKIQHQYGLKAWESGKLLLKVYDVTNHYFYDSRQVSEVQVNDYCNNWYIHTGQPGNTFLVELGLLLANGTYIFIARSNMVTMPRDNVSDIVDEEWLLPAEYEKRVYGRYVEVHGSPGFIQEMELRAITAKKREEYISSPINW